MLQTDGVVSAPTLNGKEDGLNGKDLDGHAEDGHAEQQKPARAEVPHGDEGLAESVAKKVEQAEPVSVEACAYKGAPVPTNEKERHETLGACNILDSSPDPRFDDITKLVRPAVLRTAFSIGADARDLDLQPCWFLGTKLVLAAERPSSAPWRWSDAA